MLQENKNEIGENYILFPTSDISALNVSELNEKFKNPNQHIADSKTIQLLTEKKKFYYSLQKYNVPSPKTIFLTKPEEDISIIEKNDFPLIIKPSQSQNFAEQFSKKGFIAYTQKDLIKYLKISKENNIEVFIQEIIPGPTTNYYLIEGYFDKNSKPLIMFACQRLRMWPPLLGNSTVLKSIPLSEVNDMKETLVKYLNNIGYRGIFDAEFKIDSRDNIAKLIEINARSWWQNSFPTSCGVNIIFTAYLDAIGEEIKNVKNYQTDKYMIYLTEDLKSILVNKFNTGFYFHNRSSILKDKVDWLLYNKQDIKPFIMKILKMISDIINHPKKFINILHKDKPDI